MKPYRLRKNIVQAGQAVHSITALNDAPWRWAHGIQAGLAMGIPLGIFTFIGEQQLGLMASLGGLVKVSAFILHHRRPIPLKL